MKLPSLFLLLFLNFLNTYSFDFKTHTKMRYAKYFGMGVGAGIAISNFSISNQQYAQQNPGIKAVHDQYGSIVAPEVLAKFSHQMAFRSVASLAVATTGQGMSLIDFKHLEDIDPALAHVYKQFAGEQIVKDLIGKPDAHDCAAFFIGDAAAQCVVDGIRHRKDGEWFSFRLNPSMAFAGATLLYIGINKYLENPIVKEESKKLVARSWFPWGWQS